MEKPQVSAGSETLVFFRDWMEWGVDVCHYFGSLGFRPEIVSGTNRLFKNIKRTHEFRTRFFVTGGPVPIRFGDLERNPGV